MARSRTASSAPLTALVALLVATAGAACGGGAGGAPPPDPLAAEVGRWSAFLAGGAAPADIKQVVQPVLTGAEQALQDGRRLLALNRLAAARMNLAAAAYLGERPAGERKDEAAFEAEWARMGGVLRGRLEAPSPTVLDGIEPAAVRALGEVALPQIKAYYEASLEYARSTTPESGLFYLGAARAQRDFIDFCRTLSAPSGKSAPPLRALGEEIDGLEAEVLAAYRPPASIDRHGEFIGVGSALKEARELDAAGLRYGALLRYLQAAQRLAPLRPAAPGPAADVLATKLEELDARLSAGGVDHSLGRLFLEAAQADVAHAAPGASPALAAAVAGDVLPRYFAAIGPAPKREPEPSPKVTVTMVRWPYT